MVIVSVYALIEIEFADGGGNVVCRGESDSSAHRSNVEEFSIYSIWEFEGDS